MKISLNIMAEDFIGKANGVYTAFIEAIDALKKIPEIDLTINGQGTDYDVIHSHTIGFKYIWRSFFCKKKMIVSAHVVPDSFIGSLIFSKLWQPLAKMYLKFVYSRARMVIAVSPVVKTELEKIGLKTEINVLCNSVDRNKFKQDTNLRKQFREKYNISQNAFVASCVGQIQPRKGVVDFIEAAKMTPDVIFLWVGGRPYGKLTEDYEHMTQVCDNAPGNVIFTDAIEFEEMPAAYAASDVYFMPSYQENFAFATIEASSVKLPLVMRDNIEYPSSLLTHYLKAQNAEGFAELIQKLKNDKGFFATWQKESDILASKYEINSYMKQLLQHYSKVASENIIK